MDCNDLKKNVKKITMPDEMKARIIKKCKSKNTYETEESLMKNITAERKYKKPILIALAATLFVCFALGAAAAGHYGYFSDIIRWDGAVIGAQYENASEEIDVNVISAEKGTVTVSAVLLKADALPYSEHEYLGIGSYEIINAEGNVIARGDGTEFAEIIGGMAEIKISAEGIEGGDYKLIISSFIGTKKADQPLNIYGEWECEFAA